MEPTLNTEAAVPMPPKLGVYTDFRKLLRDFYDYKRHLTRKDLRPYSYATFAAAADIKSPNYLKLIIEGERNLSSDMTLKGKGDDIHTRTDRNGQFEFATEKGQSYKVACGSRLYEVVQPTGSVKSGETIEIHLKQKN